MIDELENQQFFCEDRRKYRENHTYKNDREIIEGMRCILDLNMQIPSTDEDLLIDLLHRKGVLKFQQALMTMIMEEYPTASKAAAVNDGGAAQ